MTFEAWIKPANTTQGGPARIVTISLNPSLRNFTLAQQTNTYDVRLRTTSTSSNGMPSVSTPAGTLTTNLTHVVYTRDVSGAVKIYIDGNEVANGNIGGDCSTWDDSYNLALANELTNDRSWLGEIYLIAIYDRALTEPEVDQNFTEGAILECNVDGDCDDSNTCTDGTCVDYECQYTNNASACDDGLFCNGNDTCNGGSCSIHAGNPCPETECNTCQETTDSCFDPTGTACTDDGNVCTDDQCDGTGSCIHLNNNAPCDDGLFCNGNDLCGGGSCSFHTGNPCPETACNTCQEDTDNCFDQAGTVCTDDGNVCTDDQCDGTGVCVHPNNNDPCNDGLFCNGNDTCSGGSCSIHAGNPCPEIECNTCQEDIDSCFDPAGTACTSDGNGCTDDECDGTGTCIHPNNNAPCDDGLFCNGLDICSGGSCSFHAGTPCPETECNTCQEATDSCFDQAGTPCTDDGNVCTDDECNSGVCTHPNNTAPCDDGLFCNGSDVCSGGSCSDHTGSPCLETECNTCQEATDSCFDQAGTVCSDDGNICTDDQCNGTGTCLHPNNSSTCDDGLFCTQIDECQGGQCLGSGDPCLDDEDFCNGVEYCQEDVGSFLCNSTGDPCDLLLTCDEAGDVCDVSDVLLIIADAFGYSGTIDIELENSLDPVGEVHVDVCDKDQRVWLQIDTSSCDTTARSSAFSCSISDLGSGCVRVDLTTLSAVIDPGTGVIAQLTYTIDANAPLGDFADLIPENSDVRDDTASSLSVTPKTGLVGVVECTADGDCDDFNECTDGSCVGNVCQYSNNTASCDDGIFCNGNDTCSGGSCSVHAGDSCPSGTTCNENTDACDTIPVTSTTTTINSSTTTECATDDDCDDDELFCTGAEICVEGECWHEGSPCPEGTICSEETEECIMGVCAISLEPGTTALVSEQSLNFSINKTADCGDSDYEWSVQSEIGSAIDQNGTFAAGINTDCLQEVTDIIKVIDSANDISAEAIVTVSCDRIKQVINISNPLWIFSPSDIYSSHWLALPRILLIFAEQGNFGPNSSLNFEPAGSITTLFNIGRNNSMIALVRVAPNSQEGPYRASVTTDSHLVTKKDALMMHMMPCILDEEINN